MFLFSMVQPKNAYFDGRRTQCVVNRTIGSSLVAASLLMACLLPVTAQVTTLDLTVLPYGQSDLPWTSYFPDLVTSGPSLSEKVSRTLVPHRIGILPSLSDQHLEAILHMLQNEQFAFQIVNLTTSTTACKTTCSEALRQIKSTGVSVVIGPFHQEYAVVCRHLRLPYLVTSMIPRHQRSNAFVVELFPNSRVFARSLLDIIRYYDYKKVAVIYDSVHGAVMLESLLRQPNLEITAYHVQTHNMTQMRHALKTMRDKFFESFVSVLSSPDITEHVLDEALSLSMFSSPFKWTLVNTGLQELSLEKYVDSRANITVLRLMMDYDSPSCALQPDVITLRRAIVHDAVRVYMTYVEERANQTHFSMRQANREMETDGCTGHLEFTRDGRRRESFLQLITLQGYRTGKVTDEEFLLIMDLPKRQGEVEETRDSMLWCQRLSGTWRSSPADLKQRVMPSKTYSRVTRLDRNVFGDVPLRITTLLEPPFVQNRTDHSTWRTDGVVFETSTGSQLEGMCVDILLELSKMLGFKFKVTLVPDGKFGSLKPPPRGWTGMVRQLKDDKADLALAPFQMSAERSTVVDFTKPFMTKGTTLVVRRPEQHIWIFQFLSPLSGMVWSAIFLSFIVVSLTLFGVSRVNSDRQARYTSNLRESFWYIWGTLLRGSLNGAPLAISSRIVSSAWWFFCLIVSSIYTANLAAFLTITIGDAGINSAADLANQDYYDYGTVEGSQTETFFNHTRMADYAKMWAHMSTLSPNSIVRRVENGFDRVKEGKYAFIWDSPRIRHEISNDCSLIEIGASFDNKGYGFAIQKHAAFGDRLSWALLKLNDDGILYRLERKWWRPQFCPNERQSATTDALRLEMVSGMYLVILAGIVVSVALCVLQYGFAQYRRQHGKKRSTNDDDSARTREPCLKAGSEASSSTPETMQVYANHSPYTFRTYTSDDW